MKYQVKAISIGSLVLSGIPALLFLLGLFGGLMTFIVMPTAGVADLPGGQKLLAAGMFSLLYMVLMVCLLVLVAFLYNFFTQTVGLRGLSLTLEGDEDAGAPQAEGEAGQG